MRKQNQGSSSPCLLHHFSTHRLTFLPASYITFQLIVNFPPPPVASSLHHCSAIGHHRFILLPSQSLFKFDKLIRNWFRVVISWAIGQFGIGELWQNSGQIIIIKLQRMAIVKKVVGILWVDLGYEIDWGIVRAYRELMSWCGTAEGGGKLQFRHVGRRGTCVPGYVFSWISFFLKKNKGVSCGTL